MDYCNGMHGRRRLAMPVASGATKLCWDVVQPGDCVILNAANSTVGQLVMQLCRLLRLRCVAVVRDHGQTEDSFSRTRAWLQGLGASEVIRDAGSIKVCTQQQSPHTSIVSVLLSITVHVS